MTTSSVPKASIARAAFESQDVKLSKTVHETYTSESGHLQQSDLGRSFSLGIFNSVAAVLVLKSSTSLNIYELIPALVGLGLAQAYLQTLVYKTDRDFYLRERRREAWELKNFEEGEVKEMIEHYVKVYSFDETDASTVVRTLVNYKEAFVDFMMREELQLAPPTKDSLISLFSSSLIGYFLSSLTLCFFFFHYPDTLSTITFYFGLDVTNNSSSGDALQSLSLFGILLILAFIGRAVSATSVSKTSMLIGSISYLGAAIIAAIVSIYAARLMKL
jgi:hypothetical protein